MSIEPVVRVTYVPMIDVDSASPAPSAYIGSCDPVYRGIAALASDPSVPIVAALGQSFVVALRIRAPGYDWHIATDAERLVRGNVMLAVPSVDEAFELANSVTISDASYGLPSPDPAGSPSPASAASTQFFLFNVLREPFQTLKPGMNARLAFTQTDPGGNTVATETFTVSFVANRTSC